MQVTYRSALASGAAEACVRGRACEPLFAGGAALLVADAVDAGEAGAAVAVLGSGAPGGLIRGAPVVRHTLEQQIAPDAEIIGRQAGHALAVAAGVGAAVAVAGARAAERSAGRRGASVVGAGAGAAVRAEDARLAACGARWRDAGAVGAGVGAAVRAEDAWLAPAAHVGVTQAPLVQVSEQQSEPKMHGWPSAAHVGVTQALLAQVPEQQSAAEAHGEPSAEHPPAQALLLQTCEQ